jgi:hypothetical protein
MKTEDLLPYALWLAAGVLSLVLARRSQIDTWAEQNPRLAGALKLLRSLGLDPWMLVQGLALLVRGRLPVKLQAEKIVAAEGVRVSPEVLMEVAKQSSPPPPPDDGPPTKKPGSFPPVVGMLLIAGSVAFGVVVSACSPAATPEARGAEAAQMAPLAYNAAAVSVQALITVHTAWMDAVAASGDVAAAQAVAPTAKRVTAALESASAALVRARQYLETGESEAKVRQQIREAVGFADLAVELLAAAGRPLPDKALDALAFLRGLLGTGGGK